MKLFEKGQNTFYKYSKNLLLKKETSVQGTGHQTVKDNDPEVTGPGRGRLSDFQDSVSRKQAGGTVQRQTCST